MKLKLGVALLALVSAVIPSSLFANSDASPGSHDAARAYANLPLHFEPTSEQGRFLARSGAYSVLIGADESVIGIPGAKAPAMRTLRFSFDHANAGARIEGIEPLPGVSNYYVGNDPSQWRLGVKTYAKLRTKDVYPGVDIVYYGDNRRLEFDFVVAPKADPGAIALTLSGMDKLYINGEGDLVAEVNGQPVRFAKPYAYQKVEGLARRVSAEYALSAANKAALKIGEYDKNRELVIDPTLSYSTYLGGSQGDTANGIAVDTNGNAYVTGETCSVGEDSGSSPEVVFPGIPYKTGMASPAGAAATSQTCVAYVTKLDRTGSKILFTTYLGGAAPTPANAYATGASIVLDDPSLNNAIIPNGRPNIYVAGTTSFTDMPGAGAYNGGDSDAFVTILDSLTGALLRSTYVGGNLADTAYGITVDPQQNITVVGQTNSFNFPAYNGFEPITETYVAFATKLDFGLHIDKPSNTAPLLFGSSPLTPRHHSSTDACATGQPCPATPNPNLTYYFFSAVYGGQLVAPRSTWPVDPVSGAVLNYWTPTGTQMETGRASCPFGVLNGNNCIIGNVPLGAITIGMPYNCPNQTTTTYPAVKLVALQQGVAENLLWGTCNSNTLGGIIYDQSGMAWEILAIATQGGGFIPPTYATTEAYGVALDPAGDVFVVGGSNTADLHPSLPGPAFINGGFDWLPQADTHYAGTGAWIIKMLGKDSFMGSSDAGTPVYLTPLETTQTDVTQHVDAARAITVDGHGRAYVVGTATGTLHSAGQGVNQSPLGTSPSYDAFLLRMNAAGSGIDYATYLGGTGYDQGLAVAVDASGWAYVAGSTKSKDIPVINPIVLTDLNGKQHSLSQLNNPQQTEAYLAKVTPDGSSLIVSAYLGGSGGDQANAIVLSPSGNGDIYLAGNTNSSDFPVVPVVPYSSTVPGISSNAGNGDAFVTMILGSSFPQVSINPSSLTFPDQVVGFSSSTTETITVTSTGTVPLTINSIGVSGDFSQTNTCGTGLPPNTSSQNSCTITVTFTPSVVAGRSGSISINDNATNVSDNPQTVSLYGNGVLVGDSVTPATLTFPSTTVGSTSAPLYVTVKDTDSAQTLILSSFVASGNYSISSNTCNTLLTPGQTCAIGVVFTPTLPGQAQGNTASLVVNGNGNNMPASVTLTGIGSGAGSTGGTTTTPGFTLTPPTQTMSVTGGKATVGVTLTAVNGFAQTVSLTCTGQGGASCSPSTTSTFVNTTSAPVISFAVNVGGGGGGITVTELMRPGRLLACLLPFGGIGLVLVGRRKSWLVLLALALCLALGMAACGGGGSSSGSAAQPSVTVTATSQDGSATQTATYYLNQS